VLQREQPPPLNPHMEGAPMMEQSMNPDQGAGAAADAAEIEQERGSASGAVGGDAGGASPPVGVTAAVERGPAELSGEGEAVPENPHASLEDREPSRSTDGL
jgi:hypothetical protein